MEQKQKENNYLNLFYVVGVNVVFLILMLFLPCGHFRIDIDRSWIDLYSTYLCTSQNEFVKYDNRPGN